MPWLDLESEVTEEFGGLQTFTRNQLRELGGYLIRGQVDESKPERKAYKAAWAKAYRAKTQAHKAQYAKHREKRLAYQREYDKSKKLKGKT